MRGTSSRKDVTVVLERGSACLRCKRRKKRCDGTKPICGPCVRFDTADQCEFPRPPTPKLKPKPPPPQSKSKALRTRTHTRDLEEQLAALQKAVGASQQAKDAIAAAGNTSLLAPRQTSDSYDYNMGHQHPDEMDEDTFHPKVESPLPQSTSPEPVLVADEQALTEELRRCAFECDEGRFAIQFHAPTDSPDALHPGLVSAVLLLGYHFAPTASTLPSILSSHRQANNGADLEAYFLQQTCDELAKSLTDRPGDFLRGTALLVWYYFAKGHIAEAQYRAGGVSCFASACRLHLLSNPSLANLEQPIPQALSQQQPAAVAAATASTHGDPPGVIMSIQNQPTPIIAPAKSRIELEERISLFWTIFVLDRYAALICGTNTSIRDESVWTSWPRDADEWGLARAGLPATLLMSPPSAETLFPVLDYSSINTPAGGGGGHTSGASSSGGSGPNNEMVIISRSDLSYRAVSVLLLERSTRLAKATSGPQAALYKEYDLPFLQRSFTATKATAHKITTWLAPLSVLLQLGSATGTPLSAAAVAPGHHRGQHSYSHAHANPHTAHVPSHQYPASGPPLAPIIGLGTTSLSPHLFHSHSKAAEGPASGVSGVSSSNRAAGQYNRHQHQQPPSPLYHPQADIGGDFVYGDGTSGLGGFKSPAEAAALLFCHSALNTTWIHLNNARSSNPSLAHSGSGESYRPVPGRLSSSPSSQGPLDGQTSAAAMYQHAQQPTHPPSHTPTPQPYQHQQHPVYGSYGSGLQQQKHQSSSSIPSAASGPNSGAPSAPRPTPWATWASESDPSIVGVENMDLPPWIAAAGTAPGSGQPYQTSYPQAVQVASQRYPSSQSKPSTSIENSELGSGMSSLVAAREIADLASTTLALPAIFDELDMTIGMAWTVAVQVLTDELHRRETIHTRDHRDGSRHDSPIGHDSPSHFHLQQIPGQQSYHHPTSGHFPTPSPIEHPGTPIHPSYLRAPVGEVDDVDFLASIRDQRKILMHALDRLSGMFPLVGASSPSSSPSSRTRRRNTSSSPFSSASTAYSSSSSTTVVSLSEEMMLISSGGLLPFLGIVEGGTEGYTAGSGTGVGNKVEADSFGSSSYYQEQSQHDQAIVGGGAPDTILITPAGKQVPSRISSTLSSAPSNDCSQGDFDFFNNSVGSPSEPELFVYTL